MRWIEKLTWNETFRETEVSASLGQGVEERGFRDGRITDEARRRSTGSEDMRMMRRRYIFESIVWRRTRRNGGRAWNWHLVKQVRRE